MLKYNMLVEQFNFTKIYNTCIKLTYLKIVYIQ